MTADAVAPRFEALEHLDPEWRALHDATPGALPFADPAWYRTWLRHFPVEEARIVAVRAAGELVGVVPLATGAGEAVGLGNPKIQDYAGWLARPGCEPEVAAGLVALLTQEGLGSFRAWGLGPGDRLGEELAHQPGWGATLEPEAVAPSADLPADFEAFVAALGKKDRHELRRKLRNLEAAGEVGFREISDAQEVTAVLPSLFEMMRASHEGKARFLERPEIEPFFSEMAPAMAEAGLGRAWVLSVDGIQAAIILGFVSQTTVFLYNSGYDPQYGRLAVGLLSKARCLEAAVLGGRRRFDFMRGEEEYKRRLGGTTRVISTLTLRRH